MLGQPSLAIESFRMHCGKILNHMNSTYHMAFIIWRGPSYRITLQTPPTQVPVILSVSVTVLMKVFVLKTKILLLRDEPLENNLIEAEAQYNIRAREN